MLGVALGGAIAAPFSAWLVSRVSPALLSTAVGGVIVVTNSQKLVKYFGVEAPWSTLTYGVIVAVWAALVVVVWRASKAPAFAPGEPGPHDAASTGGTDSGTGTALR